MTEYSSDAEHPSPAGSSKKLSNASQSLTAVAVVAAQRRSVVPRPIATRDKLTDNNIFALGEAASCLEDIDDVLAGFGADFSELLNADGGSITTTCCPLKAAEGRIGEKPQAAFGAPPEDGNDASDTVQISTISKKYPDGRTINTRVIHGPIQSKKRVVRVLRDTAKGSELLAEVDVPADCPDVSAYLESLQKLGRPGRQSRISRQDSTGDYDNIEDTGGCIGVPEIGNGSKPTSELSGGDSVNAVRRPLLPNGGTNIPQVVVDVESPALPFTKPTVVLSSAQMKRVSFQQRTSLDSSIDSVTDVPTTIALSSTSPTTALLPRQNVMNSGPRQHRFASVTEEEIRRYLPLSILSAVSESEVETEELSSRSANGTSGDVIEDEEDQSSSSSLCWSCARVIKTKSQKAMPKKLLMQLARVKSRMTSSELNSEDDRSMPNPHSIVANYARMLCENRPLFVETLFRAVKLNKLDVLKVLCKIVQKSGLKLGHRDFREPESSATILHVALLYNHADIVEFLIGTGDRDLLLARYETAEYRNQTSLHVAVANGNNDVVERLILALDTDDRVTLVNTLADGYYFRSQHPHGQLCLTAAAWAGSGQVIKTLVTYGGTLTMKNLAGNTLLHSIIIQSAKYPGRYDYEKLFDSVLEASEIWAEQLSYDTRFAQQRELEKSQMQTTLFKELLSIRNNDGFTPLAMATMQNSRLFQHIIELEKIYKIPQNKLGSIAWMTYDVTDITSFACGTYNKFSVLHILAHNSQHLSRHASLDAADAGDEDVMEMEPVRTMLTRKWDVYRWIYILWFVVHLAYMIVFTAATVEVNSSSGLTRCNFTTPTLIPGTRTLIPGTTRPWVQPETQSLRLGLALFLVLPVVYAILELLDLFGTRPYRIQFMTGQNYAARIVKGICSEWTITGNGPYRVVNVGFSTFTVYWFVLYARRDCYQDAVLAIALLLGWIFVLFFTRGCRVTCRFSIMIQKMFFRDLIYFLTVYGIVLVGFSFAMNVLFEYSSVSKVSYFYSIL